MNCVRNEPTTTFTFFIISKSDLSEKDLANLIANAVNFKGKIEWDINKPDGTPKKQLDIRHLTKMGWQPKIDLKIGIKNTADSFASKYKSNLLRL